MRPLAKIIIVCLVSPSFSFLPAQKTSSRIANYTIRTRLFPVAKIIEGTEKIVWHNRTKDIVPTIQLHLYMNAFQGPQTTFMRERYQSQRFGYFQTTKKWGDIVINRIQILHGADLTAKKRFIQPEDGNIYDETVVEVDLLRGIQPDDSLCVEIDFVVALPEIIARTGYHNNFFMVGQWFPKLGVYEPGKGWNCHQFHANSEFYADFGIYDVTIRLPAEYIVGATGSLIEQHLHDDSTMSYRYRAQDVHDFAWTAYPEFEILNDTWQDIAIRFLIQPEHRQQAERQLAALKHAFVYCDDWFGTYPYPVLTVVDPPDAAFQAGGMEYPMLITAGFTYDLWNISHFMEEVAVHEFCHQYWYGVVANNEAEEAWLDEGFTTYSEMKIIDKFYNGSINLAKFSLLNRDITWLKYALDDARYDRIYQKSWAYDLGNYYNYSYNKPALLLLTLENLVGEEVMRSFFQVYMTRFRFQHVSTPDFIATFCEVAGADWRPFLEQVIYESGEVDYRIYSVTSRRLDDYTHPDQYESKVVVLREGEVICPVEIKSCFKDGSSRCAVWDGRERYLILSDTSAHPLLSAELDPQGKNWLDIDRLNNSKNAKQDRQITGKIRNLLLFWVQYLFSLMHYFI